MSTKEHTNETKEHTNETKEHTNEKDKHHDGGVAGSRGGGRMKRKVYEAELRRLDAELVAMQEWVKFSGAKICVVFEGRDTAGKGGTIKAITDRVSPRVFRV